MLQSYFYADCAEHNNLSAPNYFWYWNPWCLALQCQAPFVAQDIGIQREDKNTPSNPAAVEIIPGSCSTIKLEAPR